MADIPTSKVMKRIMQYCILYGIDMADVLNMDFAKYEAWFEHVTKQVSDPVEFKLSTGLDLDKWEYYMRGVYG